MRGWKALPPEHVDPNEWNDAFDRYFDTVNRQLDLEERLQDAQLDAATKQKKIDALEVDLEKARDAIKERRETRRYAFTIFLIVTVFTMVMYYLQGTGAVNLDVRLLYGLLTLTIGQVAGLIYIAYHAIYGKDKPPAEDEQGEIIDIFPPPPAPPQLNPMTARDEEDNSPESKSVDAAATISSHRADRVNAD